MKRLSLTLMTYLALAHQWRPAMVEGGRSGHQGACHRDAASCDDHVDPAPPRWLWAVQVKARDPEALVDQIPRDYGETNLGNKRIGG